MCCAHYFARLTIFIINAYELISLCVQSRLRMLLQKNNNRLKFILSKRPLFQMMQFIFYGHIVNAQQKALWNTLIVPIVFVRKQQLRNFILNYWLPELYSCHMNVGHIPIRIEQNSRILASIHPLGNLDNYCTLWSHNFGKKYCIFFFFFKSFNSCLLEWYQRNNLSVFGRTINERRPGSCTQKRCHFRGRRASRKP